MEKWVIKRHRPFWNGQVNLFSVIDKMRAHKVSGFWPHSMHKGECSNSESGQTLTGSSFEVLEFESFLGYESFSGLPPVLIGILSVLGWVWDWAWVSNENIPLPFEGIFDGIFLYLGGGSNIPHWIWSRSFRRCSLFMGINIGGAERVIYTVKYSLLFPNGGVVQKWSI